MSDVWVVPIEDLGREEKQVHCRTHLGHLLKVGDVALGFNLMSANVNDPNVEVMKKADIPSVVSTHDNFPKVFTKLSYTKHTLVKYQYTSQSNKVFPQLSACNCD